MIAVTSDNASARRRRVAAKTIRLRDKEHCKFVSDEPCVVCGRTPTEAHHIRFAQPRALGRKVSDEYTVPVCRLHHRDLHGYGDEASWWAGVGIDPLPIALELWRRSRLTYSLAATGPSPCPTPPAPTGEGRAGAIGRRRQGNPPPPPPPPLPRIHLPQLLDDVARGETIVITQHSRAIAQIVPEAHLRQAEVERAIAKIKALRQRTGKVTVDELISVKREGHKC